MAVVTIVNEDRKLTDAEEITTNLSIHGIDYERWTPSHPISDAASSDEILNAYSREIDALNAAATGLPV
jgi:cupin superfamily acireductone dioxygenase involved in methionine salvage